VFISILAADVRKPVSCDPYCSNASVVTL